MAGHLSPDGRPASDRAMPTPAPASCSSRTWPRRPRGRAVYSLPSRECAPGGEGHGEFWLPRCVKLDNPFPSGLACGHVRAPPFSCTPQDKGVQQIMLGQVRVQPSLAGLPVAAWVVASKFDSVSCVP